MSRPEKKYPQELLDKLEKLRHELDLARKKGRTVEIIAKEHDIMRTIAELEYSV